VRRQAQDRLRCLAVVEQERQVRAVVRVDAHDAAAVRRHHQMKRRAERPEVGQRPRLEALDGGDRGPRA
jgi:hypothetical protein